MPKTLALEVENVQKYFPIKAGFLKRVVGHIKAVDGVSFSVYKGETFGLVGESGCGKTTLGKCILHALEPTGGRIQFHRESGEVVDIAKLDRKSLKGIRQELQLIFQDPYSSLNPRLTVKDLIGEPLLVNNIAKGDELNDMVIQLIRQVGLRPQYMDRYPHAFSGGQRQRIAIARALSLNPSLVVCDEAVSALDVSIQAQIINLLEDLQQELNLTYIFISHDLSVVKHLSTRIGVMYAGKIVEIAETDDLFSLPKHPYTEALMSFVPKTDPDLKTKRVPLKGEVPNPAELPTGCAFHPRCAYANPICSSERPSLIEVEGNVVRQVACHLHDELDLQGIY